MTPELTFGLVGLLISILSVGAALAWLIVAGQASLRRDLGERMGMLDSRMSAMESRMSSVERELGRTQGLMDGLREAMTGGKETD